MSRAYRIWDGQKYITKFEVEDCENPKKWALRKQKEGYKVEVGTMIWDDKDICGWQWEERKVKNTKRNGGLPKISYALAKKFLDLKAECDNLMQVAENIGCTQKEINSINSQLNKPRYKNYVQMWELGVTEYYENYKETITEKIFNDIWDKWEEGLTQTLIG